MKFLYEDFFFFFFLPRKLPTVHRAGLDMLAIAVFVQSLLNTSRPLFVEDDF